MYLVDYFSCNLIEEYECGRHDSKQLIRHEKKGISNELFSNFQALTKGNDGKEHRKRTGNNLCCIRIPSHASAVSKFRFLPPRFVYYRSNFSYECI